MSTWSGISPSSGLAFHRGCRSATSSPGGLPDEPPPTDGSEWSRWAYRAGGYDLQLTMLRVTIVARTETTVVIDTPIISQTATPPPQGVGVLRPAAGGAEIDPRRYHVQLEGGGKPMVILMDRESASVLPPSWRLGTADVEQFHIWATSNDDLMHTWTMQLPLLVDGRRILHDVSRDGQPFVTVGSKQPHDHLWRPNDEWEALSVPKDTEPPEGRFGPITLRESSSHTSMTTANSQAI